MATFQFKFKSYDNEEGEYIDWQSAESGTIIQFILQHWFNELLPNNLDIIIIKNEKGDQLVLDHENKHVFRYFLLPKEGGLTYYYKMTSIEFMFFTLEHFFSGHLSTLQESLNKTTDDARWVRGDFIGKSFHFKLNGWRVFRQFLEVILFSAGWAVASIYALALALSDKPLQAAIAIGLALLVTAFKFKNYRNRIHWYYDQKPLQIQLSKGDRFIHVWWHGQKKSIAKADINSIEQHSYAESDEGQTIWIALYTQINFLNGDTLNIHRMLMPQNLLKEKFYHERGCFQELLSDKRSIQKKTNLLTYFPEAPRHRYVK